MINGRCASVKEKISRGDSKVRSVGLTQDRIKCGVNADFQVHINTLWMRMKVFYITKRVNDYNWVPHRAAFKLKKVRDYRKVQHADSDHDLWCCVEVKNSRFQWSSPLSNLRFQDWVEFGILLESMISKMFKSTPSTQVAKSTKKLLLSFSQSSVFPINFHHQPPSKHSPLSFIFFSIKVFQHLAKERTLRLSMRHHKTMRW